jgi:Fe2+ or Zn2+ uptake regulation protein
MFVPCINSIKALLMFHNDAHNHKITGILKQLKIPEVPFSTVYRTLAQQAGMLP